MTKQSWRPVLHCHNVSVREYLLAALEEQSLGVGVSRERPIHHVPECHNAFRLYKANIIRQGLVVLEEQTLELLE